MFMIDFQLYTICRRLNLEVRDHCFVIDIILAINSGIVMSLLYYSTVKEKIFDVDLKG